MLTKAVFSTTRYLHAMPRRSLFISTSQTPNPACLKFIPGKPVTGDIGQTMDFSSIRYTSISPLAQ